MCIRDSIYCVHHELDGKSFYDEYCEGYAHSNEEDGMLNAGYAVWRECIAEIIAIECDDNCEIFPIRDKKKILAQLRDEINQRDGLSLIHIYEVFERDDKRVRLRIAGQAVVSVVDRDKASSAAQGRDPRVAW